MNTVYFPQTGHEVFAMLPASTKAEYGITEGCHWAQADAYRELVNLALSALRCCRTSVRKGMLVHVGNSVCICMHATHKHKHMQSIDALQCYMNSDDVFEFLSHSGIAYSPVEHMC